MQNRDAFSSCHPVINFLYFALVLLVTMFCLHPIILGLSLAGSVVYAVYLNGQRAVRFSLAFLLPMMLLTLIITPSFNHQGITILTYLPTGNPLTLESILYGVSAAAAYTNDLNGLGGLFKHVINFKRHFMFLLDLVFNR